jgi:hypothetical protein
LSAAPTGAEILAEVCVALWLFYPECFSVVNLAS